MGLSKAGRALLGAMLLGSLVAWAGCHGPELSTVMGSLGFSSPDQPDSVTQPDAGLVHIDLGAASVGAIKTLTLDLESVVGSVSLGRLVALQDDPEFGLPLVMGTQVLGPGSPTPAVVSFAPSSPGNKSARYQLTAYTPATETVVIELGGVAVANALSVTPNPVDFGRVQTYETLIVAVTFSNGSPLPENLTLSPLQGAGAASFTVGHLSTATLAAGGTATVNVTFEPTKAGGVGASFTASAGPGIFPVTVNLGGFGLPPS